MAAQIYCPDCGWVDVSETELINVEEGPQGEDVAYVVCQCGTNVVSVVRMAPDYDDDYDDSMDGDFDTAMASAGFGTDEDYGCTEDF